MHVTCFVLSDQKEEPKVILTSVENSGSHSP